jgi:hypothetical protein
LHEIAIARINIVDFLEKYVDMFDREESQLLLFSLIMEIMTIETIVII